MKKVCVTQQEFKSIINKHIDKYSLYTPNQYTLRMPIDPSEYEEWFVVEEEQTIYVVPKNKFDFSKYNYLPDMISFMKDVKYMFDNHNSPNSYSFSQVEQVFAQIFEKGQFQPEEVKNQLGEMFTSFIDVLVDAYGLMTNKSCSVKDLFEAIQEGLFVKDVMPFVQKVMKDKINRPEFKFDKQKLEVLDNSEEYKFVKNWTSHFLKGVDVEDGNYIINEKSLPLLLTHIVLNGIIVNEQTDEFRGKLQEALIKYMEVFEVGYNFYTDVEEFDSKITLWTCNYNNWCLCEADPENSTKSINKIYKGWYETGFILGSPSDYKLF